MTNFRGLINSMLVIGSAQAINILTTIIRMKVLAVLLGPSGIGLLSVYNNLKDVVSQTAGLGIGSSGVREIASARGEEATLSRVRRVLFAAHLVQGGLAMLAVWLLRDHIAILLFGDIARATEVGLIGIASLMTLLTVAQIALLQGMRKIVDLGRVTVLGAFVGTVIGLVAVWWQGENGLIWFIIVQPLATVLIALRYTQRLPNPTAERLSLVEIWEIWKPMAKLGVAFMLGALVTTATLLFVRGRISQELGLDSAGHFAAAWSIAMTYVGFLLGAMGTDFYPRLTEIIHERAAAIQLINDQAQLGLAIGGPVLLFLIGLAPWVISLLYSGEFGPAATLLQWQTVGNVFKLVSWPLGFVVVASAMSKTFMALQINWNVIFLIAFWPTLSTFGILAAGPAFVIACIIQFAVAYIVVHRIYGFRWQPLSLQLLGLHALLATMLLVLSINFPVAGALASIGLGVFTAFWGGYVVISKIGPRGRLASKVARVYEALGWSIRDIS